MESLAWTWTWVWVWAVLTLFAPSTRGGDIFTSSAKIQALLATEPVQLAALRDFLNHAASVDSYSELSDGEVSNEDKDDEEGSEGEEEEAEFRTLGDVKRFYELAAERARRLWSNQTARQAFVRHPTNAFFVIKHAHAWFLLRHNSSELLRTDLLRFLPNVFTPGPGDLLGAATAMIRLQRTYGLLPEHMLQGNVWGRQGNPLTSRDALLVARAARQADNLIEAEQWLLVLLAMDDVKNDVKAAALGQLGLIYLTMGKTEKAAEYLHSAEQYDKFEDSVHELRVRLRTGTVPPVTTDNYSKYYETTGSNYARLCSRNTTVSGHSRYHVCRWRCTLGPWLRYAEEILSIRPYASIFHDVIKPWEIEEIKRLAIKNGLNRGTVVEKSSLRQASIRTSDTIFLSDSVSPLMRRLSLRVEIITGLQTKQRWPRNHDSAEPFQVVNYGIGGHYSAHVDPIQTDSVKPANLRHSGDRLATFLYYLEDVEAGGRTVFINANISVPSVKGTALFWYNFDPAGNVNELTRHAGCPVAVGEKWVANKWIWFYGNTFRRPCPLRPGDSQWKLEKLFHTTCP